MFIFPVFSYRGGVLLTVHGENMDSVLTATLLVNGMKDDEPDTPVQQLRSVSGLVY